MSEQKLNQIETMISDLILSVGTLKAYFEEEREENQRRFAEIDRRFEQIDKRFDEIDMRFEQIDRRFEQIDKRFEEIDKRFEHVDKRFEEIDRRFEHVDKRFDEVMIELRSNKFEHDYMATRLFRAEMELESLKSQQVSTS